MTFFVIQFLAVLAPLLPVIWRWFHSFNFSLQYLEIFLTRVDDLRRRISAGGELEDGPKFAKISDTFQVSIILLLHSWLYENIECLHFCEHWNIMILYCRAWVGKSLCCISTKHCISCVSRYQLIWALWHLACRHFWCSWWRTSAKFNSFTTFTC